jgi:nucleotide-binding universal stress UspA family protein
MSYKTILLHLNDARRARQALEAVVPLARAEQAHLIGLSVVPPYLIIPAMDGAGVSVTVDQHRVAYEADAAGMKAEFDRATADLPLAAEWRAADAAFTSVAATVLLNGRATDLIVASQADPEWESSSMLEDPVRLVMEAGRPVLLIPNKGRVNLPPKRVVAAYDGRREAARALFDALPLLKSATDVTLVWVNPEKVPPEAGDVPAVDICASLSRHGVKATAIDAHAIGADVGPEILRQARVNGADLLVMGCYGHSRLRELVLGGASRYVLSNMDLPVLMSH